MCSRHVANVGRMVIQSIFTGTRGSGPHTTCTLARVNTHTHTHQYHCVDFTFVRQGFWFVASKCDTRHLAASDLCVFTQGPFSSFLLSSLRTVRSLQIIVQERGRNHPPCTDRAGRGMFVSAASNAPTKAGDSNQALKSCWR